MKTITRICALGLHIKLLLCCATSVEGILYYLSYHPICPFSNLFWVSTLAVTCWSVTDVIHEFDCTTIANVTFHYQAVFSTFKTSKQPSTIFVEITESILTPSDVFITIMNQGGSRRCGWRGRMEMSGVKAPAPKARVESCARLEDRGAEEGGM